MLMLMAVGVGSGLGAEAPPDRADFAVGPLPEELRFDETQKEAQRNAAAEIMGKVSAAIGAGERKVVIPPGHYRFPNSAAPHFEVAGAEELEIDAQGSTFWFEKGGVRVVDSRGVALRNLVIDNDPVPFMQAVVIAVDHEQRTVDLEFDPRFQMPAEGAGVFNHLTYFTPDGDRVIPMQWDGVTEWEALGGNAFRARKFQNDRLFTTADGPDVVGPGIRAAFSVKSGTWGVQLIRTRECTIEDVTVFACYGYAFHERLGEGGNTYRRCVIGRRPGTGRLLANARDGFHSYLVERGPLIEDCHFARAMDDLVAVHGFFSMVVDGEFGDDDLAREVTLVTPFEPDVREGSALVFVDLATGSVTGRAKVVELTKNPPETASDQRTVLVKRCQAAGLPVRDFTTDGVSLTVRLDQGVDLARLAGVMSDAMVSRNTVIRRNLLRDTMARGMLLKSHGLTVEDNRIERVAHSGIAVMPESFFLEGPFAQDVVIQRNRVVDCGELCYNDRFFEPFIGSIQVSNWFGKRLFDPPSFFASTPNERVAIRDNEVVRPASVGILAANVDGLEISGNHIDAPFTRTIGLDAFRLTDACLGPPRPEPAALDVAAKPLFAILVLAARNVTVNRNVVENAPDFLRGDVGFGPWVSGVFLNEQAGEAE